MASSLVQLVDSFLDLIAQDYVWAEGALKFGFQNVLEARGHRLSRSDKGHLRIGDRASELLIIRRALPGLKHADFQIGQKAILEISEDSVEDGPERHSLSYVFQEIIQMVADKQGITVDEARETIESSGATIEEMKQSLRDQMEKERAIELEQPHLGRAMLRRYLHKLNGVVDRIEGLDDLPVAWDVVPDHLKVLIANAHEAALLGQDVACAILCGTAIEEALKLTVGEANYQKFIPALRLATEKGFFATGSVEVKAAEYVKEMRNLAVHNPKKFFLPYTKPRPDVLVETRLVLAHLFSGAV